MPRTHSQRAVVFLEEGDDIWRMFAAADKEVRAHIERRPSSGAIHSRATLYDVDGQTSEQSLDALRPDFVAREGRKDLRLFYTVRPRGGIGEAVFAIAVATDNLQFPIDQSAHATFRPKINVSTDSLESEQEAIGVTEVVRKAIVRARTLPPEASTVTTDVVPATRPLPESTPTTEPGAITEPAPNTASPTPASDRGVARVMNHPWVVGIGVTVVGGLILVGILALAGFVF